MVGTATQDDIAGRARTTTSTARRSTRSSGIVLMLLVSRFDYSRLREWKLGRLRADDRRDPARLRARRRRARLASAAIELRLLQPPAVRARQGAADPGAVRLRGRPHAQARRPRDHQPHHAAGADPGDARDRPARPRLGPRVHGDRAGRAVRGRHQVDPLRGARRARRGGGGDRARGGARPSAWRCSSPTRWTASRRS